VQRLINVQGVGSLTASALLAAWPELGTLSKNQVTALAEKITVAERSVAKSKDQFRSSEKKTDRTEPSTSSG